MVIAELLRIRFSKKEITKEPSTFAEFLDYSYQATGVNGQPLMMIGIFKRPMPHLDRYPAEVYARSCYSFILKTKGTIYRFHRSYSNETEIEQDVEYATLSGKNYFSDRGKELEVEIVINGLQIKR